MVGTPDDDRAVSVEEAARQLACTTGRVWQLLSTRCPLLDGRDDVAGVWVYELTSSPQGVPSKERHVRGRTIYQSSIAAYVERHPLSANGRRRHPKHDSVTPRQASADTGRAATPRPLLGGPEDGSTSIWMLTVRLSERDREVRELEAKHQEEKENLLEELRRERHTSIDLEFELRLAVEREGVVTRNAARGQRDRAMLESVIAQERGPQDTSGLTVDDE